MDIDAMIQAGIAEFKQKMAAFCEERDLEHLSPELAEEMSKGIQTAISVAWPGPWAGSSPSPPSPVRE